MRVVERVWYDEGAAMQVARAALFPLSAGYAGTMRLRRALYDARMLASFEPALPVVSIGNLTVGGTGKTPVAAWVASRLAGRARPAMLLRGYGADEIEVHARLNPDIPVIVNANRLDGVREAKRAGADLVVADDAFQHRRMRRQADIVLLSVEQLQRPRRVLPAGPWREPLAAARGADLVVFTRKSATRDEAGAQIRAVAASMAVPYTGVSIEPAGLVDVRDETESSLETLRDRPVLAIAAIGEPGLFRSQLERLGARVELAAWRDHHAFTAADVAQLAARADGRTVVCTMKDAVKLGALWPRSSPLWYVSQRLVVDEGAEHLDRLLDRVLNARAGTTTTAG